ncbi:MAG: hypothetical protein IJE09_01230 [Oscillospiraceae bacterium]|nr:hypothetical protein [Oscillospiraceae bacterium]
MSKYGPLLKKLISFSGMKMSTVANLLSYDLSYISKWCNKSKLPAARIAPEINQTLAAVFSKEIEARGDRERFFKHFSMPAGNLEESIFTLLTDAYKDSEHKTADTPGELTDSDIKVLTQIGEIYRFFHQEFIDVICAEKDPVEILCTLDLSRLLSAARREPFIIDNSMPDMRVKIGMCQNSFDHEGKTSFKELYAFLNMYHNVAFEIYDNSFMDTMNTIVIRGRLAVLCALDQYDRISTAVVIRDVEKVNQIYLKLVPAFRSSPLLLHHERASQFNKTGYRTDFYARENYQIFTARGFEFLLPVECWKSIIQTAQMKDDGGFEARIVEKMQITWEEIFEKSSMDFFTTKSTLLKYLEDGEIVFLDVVYQMSVPERKLHIQKVLDITKKNPNIRFFVIDDDCLPDMQQLFGASVYSNRRKIFLKKISKLKDENEAQFYCVDSELLTAEIVRYMDKLRDSVYCYPFDAEALQRFVDRYGSMINRMLDLNEDRS